MGEEHQRQVFQAGDKDINVRFLGRDVGLPFLSRNVLDILMRYKQ